MKKPDYTIREAQNEVNICGVLKEKNLKKGIKDGKTYIGGNLVIQVAPDSEIRTEAFAFETNASGSKSKIYAGLETVMAEYRSIADLMQSPHDMPEDVARANATLVSTRCTIAMNDYYNDAGNLSSSIRYKASFYNRVKSEEYNPCATFEVEAYVESIRKEFKEGEETGRIFMDTYIPIYGGAVIPVTFEAEDDTAEYISDNYTPQKTCHIWGDIISKAVRKIEKRSGFGKSIEKKKVSYRRALLITGGDEEQYETDNAKSYDPEIVRKAVAYRNDEYLPFLLEKSGGKKPQPTSAPKFQYDSDAMTKAPSIPAVDNSIPFDVDTPSTNAATVSNASGKPSVDDVDFF